RGDSSLLLDGTPSMKPYPAGAFETGGVWYEMTYYPSGRSTPFGGNGRGLVYYDLRIIRKPLEAYVPVPITVKVPETVRDKIRLPRDVFATNAVATAKAAKYAVAGGAAVLGALSVRLGLQFILSSIAKI
ncbi:MAG TPA: hypothetical protein VK324_01630, partial [Tepidisphaeraceae bacterium]|nr:hypothetical protein [Tepidisphaeraceae bacterium]